MRRFLPSSLAGQMVLLFGIALLIAQIANFALVLNERQKLSLARNEGPAITNFASVAADYAHASPEFHDALISDNSRRGVRYAARPDSGIGEAERDANLEARALDALGDALGDSGGKSGRIRAARGPGTEALPPRSPPGSNAGHRVPSSPRHTAPPDTEVLRIAVQQPDGSWLTARLLTPRDPLLAVRLVVATVFLYGIVLGASLWIAIRIARPLRDLTAATDRFQGRSEPVAVPVRGPSDVRRAIEAFNAMSERLTGLLDEKDHMLGAIGHDLRTPLASLRIRIESMEPPDEREAAVAKITELTAMLEDILVLARTGRTRGEARPVDIAALAEAVVDDYQDLGQPVTFRASPRQVGAVQPDLLRRALRNLIDNAVVYGGNAEVAVERSGDRLLLSVTDGGPGIAADEIDKVLTPFYRIEGSRNRATGGSGLGLAIASSIAESHDGRLTLAAARPHGLVATLVLPAG